VSPRSNWPPFTGLAANRRPAWPCFSSRRETAASSPNSESGVKMEGGSSAGRSPAGQDLVLTGGLTQWPRRGQGAIPGLGGRVTSSVSKKTDYVVVGQDPGAKVEEPNAWASHTLNGDAVRGSPGAAHKDCNSATGQSGNLGVLIASVSDRPLDHHGRPVRRSTV